MNPVLRKDLLALLRLKRVAAIQILFIGVLSILLLATWPQGGVLTLESGRQDDLLLGLIVGQLVLLVLFVPGVSAVSLTGEKEANTLEMLYASRLSPAQIIGGKVSSAVSFPLLLLVSGLPFVALLYWRGEVDLQKLGWSYAVLVVAAIFLSIVSLTISLIAVLIPLLFMGDIVGRLFREFAITIVIAIFASGLVSLTLTPLMCARLLKERGEGAKKTWV